MPVVLARALRIETLDEVATVMIPEWSALPAGRIDVFSTGLENQQAVSVHIVQGDSEQLSQNRDVGLFTFEIAEDGTLQVTAENLGTGKKVTFPLMQLEILERES
jgi:molecular chaperone DnaK